MRRSCWYIGLSWLIGCLIGAWLSLNMLLMVTVGSILCFAVTVTASSLRCRSAVWLCALGFCGALIAVTVTEVYHYRPVQQQVGRTVTLKTVIDDTESGIYGRVIEGDLPNGTQLQLWIGDEGQKPELYEILSGTFMLCDRGETGLSLLQTKASGVWFAAVPDKVTTEKGTVPWTAWFDDLRRQATESINTHLSGDAGALTAGICFGDDSTLSDNAKSWFRVSGVSHLFSISGFHMVIIAQALQWLLNRLRLPRLMRALFSMVAMVFFMLMVGLEPSVVRSGLLCLLVLLGTCFRRQADTRNSLGLALLVLLAEDPFAAYDVGLLLSFTATFGLVLLYSQLKVRILSFLPEKWRKQNNGLYQGAEALVSAVCLTMSASLATLPVMAVFFGEVSAVAVLTNILASTPASLLMIFGCVGSVCAFPVMSVLADFCFLICGWLARLLLWITEKISNFPLVTVAIRDTYLLLWIVGTGILLYAGWRVARKTGMAWMSAISTLTLVIAMAGRAYFLDGVTTIRVFSTEKDSAFCLQQEEETVLFCVPEEVGTVYDLRTQLRLSGVEYIDTVVVPAGNEAALTAMMVLLKDYFVDTRLLYGEDAASLVSFFDECVPIGDDTLTIDKSISLTRYGTFFSLMIEETHVLVSTDDDSVWTLPAFQRQADVILYGGALPSETVIFTADVGVVQGWRHHLSSAAAYGVQQLIVADQQEIVLMTRGAGDIFETM